MMYHLLSELAWVQTSRQNYVLWSLPTQTSTNCQTSPIKLICRPKHVSRTYKYTLLSKRTENTNRPTKKRARPLCRDFIMVPISGNKTCSLSLVGVVACYFSGWFILGHLKNDKTQLVKYTWNDHDPNIW